MSNFLRSAAAGCLILSLQSAPLHRAATIGIFEDLLDTRMAGVASGLERDLSAEGYRVTRLTSDDLRAGLNCDLLLYPAGERYPAGSEAALRTFLQKGRLIVLGGPSFSEPAWKQNGVWRSWDDLRHDLASRRSEYMALDFDNPVMQRGWERAANDPTSPGIATVGDFGGGHGRSLQIDMANLTGWDGWSHVVSGLPAGRNLVTFWSRGDARTGQMMIELRERDGSRWIAVNPLTTGWDFHALAPSEFRYWQDSTSRGRGGPGDHVHLDNVSLAALGLAFSHTPMPGGPHRFWVGSIAVQRDPRAATDSGGEPLVLDSLSPSYKYFPVHGVTSAQAAANQIFLRAGSYPFGSDLVSVSPRPQGTGFQKHRAARFIPLITARDSAGRRRGYVAWMRLNEGGDRPGSAWAEFGVNDAAFYDSAKVRRAIVNLARVMLDQPLLAEGGSQYYAYFADDRSVRLGARADAAPVGPAVPAVVNITVTPVGGVRPVYSHTWQIGSSGAVTADWRPSAKDWERGEFVVRTELAQNGRVVDSLAHPLSVWRPRQPAQRAYVSARDGSFWLRGRRWEPHGVNYMPSSGIALEDEQAFEQWLGSPAYDPDVIEEDLSRIQSLGMNSISVFVYRQTMGSRNLLDLLMRAERHGLKVNLSLRPHADPFDYNWNEIRDLITFNRLADTDTIFAYDLAWERGFGSYDPSYSNVKGRKAYDPEWKSWVIERYGSIKSAETDWGTPIPRHTGEVTGPSDDMLDHDGPWRRMVAAYRRFVDDLSSRAYGRVARQIRTVDPHHLISFRMNTAGDPTAPPREFPFDFRGLGRALDIMEPEGYGRIGDWNRVREGAFTAAYSRYAAPGRPLFWAEFGMSAWAGSNFQSPNPALTAQGQFLDNIYRMVGLSSSSGSSAWWYPGGWRLNENSDFGIVNPDGGERPATMAIRRRLPELYAASRGAPPVDTWIEVDRDADSRGLGGIYAKCRAAFWKAVDSGHHPGLRDAGTGTTSVTAPLLAVGGTHYNGHNPPRFLNAEFDRLEIRDASGNWVDVSGGINKRGEATVHVAAGQPVLARAVVGNTESARWIAPKLRRPLAAGEVVLGAPGESEVRMFAPARIPSNAPTLGTAVIPEFTVSPGIHRPSRVVLQMYAWNRMWFGEKIAFHLRPIASSTRR